MTSDIFKLIRSYPITTVIILLLVFIAAFGFVGLLHGVAALALALGFLYIVADEDKSDLDDWTDPFSPI